MPKISAIIPVYNTQDYLKKCLDSVCNQTLSDIEIICINDCSSDNSSEILNEYAKNDTRFKIINLKKNQGAANARNFGIKEAKGEYLSFIDSDDFIDFDFYEKLYNEAIKNQADCAKGNYKNAENNDVDYNLNKKIKEFKTNFAYAYCSAIFKKEIIIKNQLKFPDMIDMEDPIFTFKFALLMNKIEIVDDAFINIVKRENSITSGVATPKKIQEKFKGLNSIIDIANSAQNISNESYSYVTAFWFNQTIANSITNNEKHSREFIANESFKLLKKIKNKDLFFKELEKKSIIFADYLKNNKIKDLIEHNEKDNHKKTVLINLRNNIKKQSIPKVSVIIPVYNASKYLERCLDSVKNQTLKDIEIICVDDCSIDNSLEILNEYANDDKRFKIIHHNINKGESGARNTGINSAKGEYIAFVDNDDTIDLNFLEKLYDLAKTNNLDIAKGEAKEHKNNNISIRSNDEINKYGKHYFTGDWWSAIYSRDLIEKNHIRLPENHILGGDLLFLNNCILKAKNIATTQEIYYNHFFREDSGDGKVLSEKKILSALDIFKTILNNLNLALKNNEIKDYEYDRMFFIYAKGPEYVARKTNEKNLLILCANNLIDTYNLCLRKKELIQNYHKHEYTFLIEGIITKDINRFVNLLNALKRIRILANLRANITINKYLNKENYA